LIVGVRDGIDMARREVPLRFSLYVPTLTLEESAFDLGAIRADKLGQEQHVRLKITSTSAQNEALSVVAKGLEGLDVALSPGTLPTGETTEVELTLNLPEGLEAGDYQAAARLSAREGVTLAPETVEVRWSVTPVPFMARYGLFLALIGVVMLVGLIGLGVWRSRVQRPWGVLKPLRVPAGALKLDYRLHQSDWRGRVFVGSKKGSQVLLAHPSVRPRHAVIRVETQTVTEPVGRPPRPSTRSRLRPVKMTKPVCVIRNLGDGIVQVGGARLLPGQTSPALKRGTRVRFGEFEFEWHEA
jgi:hypothetical protein